MKTSNYASMTKLFLIMAYILLLNVSCKKDEKVETHADLVGTWYTDQTVDMDGTSYLVRDVVVFTQNSFVEVAKMQDEDGNWVNLVGRKGNYSIVGDELNISLTEAGYSGMDNSGNPTGDINYYTKGSTEFNQILNEMDMVANYKALYSYSGNSLTLTSDSNNNSNYEDDDVYVFNRQ